MVSFHCFCCRLPFVVDVDALHGILFLVVNSIAHDVVSQLRHHHLHPKAESSKSYDQGAGYSSVELKRRAVFSIVGVIVTVFIFAVAPNNSFLQMSGAQYCC